MFAPKAKQSEVNYLRAEIRDLDKRYWGLWRDHKRLLDHLNLVEVTQPAKVILKVKPSSNG